MTQSPETTESNPFTKPGFIIAAALVIALIAATIVIFLLPKGQDATETAPTESGNPAATSPIASTDPSESICGLPSSSDTALGAAPKSNWELVGRMATPTDSESVGPGAIDDDGFRSCFAHSPTGALYAAANVIALGSSPEQDELKLATKLLVPDAGQDAAIKSAGDRPSSSSEANTEAAQIRGFLIRSYSATEADVDLALELPNGALVHSVLSLRWVDGDWKVKAAADGQVFNSTSQLSDLSGFLLWSGV